MKIGFIGAGKVGTAFGCYLKFKEFDLSGYFSRTYSSAQNAAVLTSSSAFSTASDLLVESDFVFITSNDDQIVPIAKKLSELNIDLTNKTFTHMSGALSSLSMKRLSNKGATVFSLHPMQSFADHKKSVSDLENTTFGIEGEKDLDKIRNLLKKTGNPYICLTPDQKTEYHITSCIVSNFLTALLDYGFTTMQSIGIDQSTAIQSLTPMIRGTVENIIAMGPQKALTGPIARGDVQTIKSHLSCLDKKDDNSANIYRQLGCLTLKLAQKETLTDSGSIQALETLLKP